MDTVAVAQNLNAIVEMINNNNVAGGIKRDASGILELTCSHFWAADGADVSAVTVSKHLQSLVVPVDNNKVALAVKRDAAVASSELPVAAASAADGAHVGAVAQSNIFQTSTQMN